MSIIADAMRKSARENQASEASASDGSRQPDTSASGRWTLLAELEKSNAALREFLSKARQGDEPKA